MRSMILKYGRRFALASISGLLAGASSTIFLIALQTAERTRDKNLWILYFLPLAGFFIGWVYHQFGQDVAAGNNLVLDEIHKPKKIIPWHMTPFILLGTVLTHLVGGSAGREGTAVQMGAALSDQMNRLFHVSSAERKIFLAAGAGAGFGAAIGTPFAGVLFAMEFLYVSKIKTFALAECVIAVFIGYHFSHFLGAPHTLYPSAIIPHTFFSALFWVAIAGIIFGLAARFFSASTRAVQGLAKRFIPYPPLRPFLSGFILILLFNFEGSFRYIGLGLPQIQQALLQTSAWTDPLFKSFFTSLTIATGFKGGEFTPLVFVGTTLGSTLSQWLPLSFSTLGAVGFAAVFAGASNTPLACSVMAMEIFGLQMGPYAFVACYVSYLFSGDKGIYASQPQGPDKFHRIQRSLFKWTSRRS